jgi:hypothetical protein
MTLYFRFFIGKNGNVAVPSSYGCFDDSSTQYLGNAANYYYAVNTFGIF